MSLAFKRDEVRNDIKNAIMTAPPGTFLSRVRLESFSRPRGVRRNGYN